MATSRIDGNVHIVENLSIGGSLAIPSGTVTDDDVLAATGVAASKLEHQFIKHHSQESGTKSAAMAHTIHTVYGATGTIQGFEAGTTTLCTDTATVTVDLVLNRAGTTASCLDAVITLDSGNTVYLPETGTVTTTALLADDTMEVVYTSADGGGAAGKGAFASMILREDAD
ncbi:unnamed protein product [marine sediment metagenome]|uniref:Uncharacterized protein n=1 Tax=marine sediment metagenome TaxID=412755 RepID=X1E755_9ZZZZ